MKSFSVFVLAAVFVTGLCDKQAEWMENSKVCTQKNDVTEADVQKVLKGEIKPADVAANMKCYFLCMTEKEGFTKDGVYQPAVFVEKVSNYLTKEETAKAAATCKDIKGTDNCDMAFKFVTCISQFKGKA